MFPNVEISYHISILFFLRLLLGYSCFIMFYQFLLYNNVNHIYDLYIYSFLLNFPPAPPPSHSSRPSQSTKLSSLCYTAASHQPSIQYIRQCIYVTVTLSMCPPFSFPLCVQKSILYISVSVPAQQKKVHQYCFSRFHIYALIYDICLFLSDLLHSV